MSDQQPPPEDPTSIRMRQIREQFEAQKRGFAVSAPAVAPEPPPAYTVISNEEFNARYAERVRAYEAAKTLRPSAPTQPAFPPVQPQQPTGQRVVIPEPRAGRGFTSLIPLPEERRR
jgi:hypothetical protein